MYLDREEEAPAFRLLGGKEALALIGPRRAGKTVLALRLLEDWKQKGGVSQYFDLEALSAPSNAKDLAREIEKIPKGGLVVLDEVQVIENWVKVVRGEVESGQRRILVTGSSASLLSKEIASSLGGRAIPEVVLPLSFRDARKWGLTSLDEYLRVGGYPECVLRPNEASRLHKLYLELTVLRDVASRNGIREIKPLSDLALLLLSETGKVVSAKKTSSVLGISQPTFRSFVQALNDAFLVFSVPPFIRSPREKIVADAKHYAFDTGLQASVSISAQEDYGRRLENVVAIEFARKGYSLSYFKNSEAECDFIAQKTGEQTLAVQVWSGEGKIPEREWAGLEKGMKLASNMNALLLTKEKTDEEKKGVMIKTVEEWLAGNSL
ncbi:ATP-binding protein [Candidatus Micrarchaeota archaeon]|nr:ATP-binding protein [Candidatus Micrarchaeota archaeon]